MNSKSEPSVIHNGQSEVQPLTAINVTERMVRVDPENYSRSNFPILIEHRKESWRVINLGHCEIE
jgi:hypothetical protein